MPEDTETPREERLLDAVAFRVLVDEKLDQRLAHCHTNGFSTHVKTSLGLSVFRRLEG